MKTPTEPDSNAEAERSEVNDERGRERGPREVRLRRRSYLKLIGIGAVAPAMGTARASDHTGYGVGGYGDGGYGGTAGDDGSDGNDGEDGTDTVSLRITTDDAIDVETTAATLRGELVEIEGVSSARVGFEYRSAADDRWTSTPGKNLGEAGMFDEPIDELTADTEYEYRAVAATETTETAGEVRSFTTTRRQGESPTIARFRVEETSPPNPHAKLEIDWAIDGEVSWVEIEVINEGGWTIDGASHAVYGRDPTGSDSFDIKHGAGATYEVTLIVAGPDEARIVETETIQT